MAVCRAAAAVALLAIASLAGAAPPPPPPGATETFASPPEVVVPVLGYQTLADQLRSFYVAVSPKDVEKAEEVAALFRGKKEQLNELLLERYGVSLRTYEGAALDLSVGTSLDLDHLGPLIIRKDGSTRRINNWRALTPAERAVAFEKVTARNRERLRALEQKHREAAGRDRAGDNQRTAEHGSSAAASRAEL